MDDSIGNELPWASVFGSTANMRAFTAIQAEGLRAASKLVDRFILAASDSLNTMGGTVGTRAVLSEEQRADLWGATDVEPLIRSWLCMLSRLGRDHAPASAAAGSAGAPTLEFSDNSTGGRIDVEAVTGDAAVVEIWLSNRGTEDVGDVRLRIGSLESDRGHRVDPSDVEIVPASVAMPARSGRGSVLRIRASAEPGVYRGNLYTEGHPDLWLPIAVTVREPSA